MSINILDLELYRIDTDEADKKAIQNELIALASKGLDAWREWETDFLAEIDIIYPNDKLKSENLNQYKIQFSRHHFKDFINFIDFKFPITVIFFKCYFDNVVFKKVHFLADVHFLFCVFHQHANFDSAQFFGNTSFKNNKFLNETYFTGTIFKEETSFSEVVFSNKVSFKNSRFCKDTNFFDIDFNLSAEFISTSFGAEVLYQSIHSKEKIIFIDCTFDTKDSNDSISFIGLHCVNISVFGKFNFKNKSNLTPCDFRQSYFNIPPLAFNFPSDLSAFRKGNKTEGRNKKFYRECETKFRELKRLAEANNNHQKAMEFYSCELYCQRKANKILKPNYLANLFYELLSGYGMSLLRPFLLWLAFLVAGVGIQALLDKGNLTTMPTTSERVAFYASPSLPPFFQDAIYQKEVRGRLYPNDENDNRENKKVNLDKGKLPMWNRIVRIVQTFVSFIALFLFGLGLRNRFKIG